MSDQTEKELLAADTQPMPNEVADEQAVAAAQAQDGEQPPASKDMPLLKVEGLKKYFPIQTNLFGKPTRYLRAVDDISFDVDTGKTIGIVGESGCGKTTLGRTILKLYDINGGKIYFDGNDITDFKKSGMQKYRTDIQLIFQDPYSSLPPRMPIGSIIAEPVKVHKIVPKDQVHSYVLDVMKKCGVKPQHYDRYPHEFSGGQRQRICIARALAVKPKLVICDEPVSALDVSIQAQIINLLKELQQTMGLSYVFISHDLSVVKYITDKILVMYLGNAMEMSETEELFDNPLHPYTKALFSAVPAPNPNVKMNRIVLEGDIPSPANPPSGCKFHTRCSECMKVCKYKQPEYIEVSKDHFVACHLYNQDIMSHLSDYDDEYDRLEEQKRIDAELAAQKKSNNPFIKFYNKLFKKNKTGEAAPSGGNEIPPVEAQSDNTQSENAPVADDTNIVVEKEQASAADNVVAQPTEATEIVTAEQPAPTESAEQSGSPVSAATVDSADNAETAATVQPDDNAETAAKPAAKRATAKKSTTTPKSTASKSATTSTKSTAAGKTTTAPKSTASKSTSTKSTAAKNSTTAAKKSTASTKKPTADETAKADKADNVETAATAKKSTTTPKSTASKSTSTRSTASKNSTTASSKSAAAKKSTAKSTAAKSKATEKAAADTDDGAADAKPIGDDK